jgi:hypothetical protein
LFANKIRVIIIGNQWLMAIILATQEQWSGGPSFKDNPGK